MSERRLVAVVYNPTKVDAADRRKVEQAITSSCDAEQLWLETTADDPGRGMAEEAVAKGADLVIAYGGDGTVRAVCTGLATGDVPLGILPGGTGNLLARNLRLPVNDLDEALEVALGGAERRIDLGRVRSDGDECFAVMAGLGFDAAIMRDAPEDMKAKVGSIAYVVSGLRHLRDRHMDLTLEVDGGAPQRRHARTVVVGNVGDLQGGVSLLPDAIPDDGNLDVIIVSPRHLLDWLRVAVRVLLRRRREDDRVEHLSCCSIKIVASRPQPRQLDGDTIPDGRELDLCLEASSLTVRVSGELSR